MKLYLSLGTNTGDRHALLHRAVALLQARVGTLIRLSALHETQPEEMNSTAPFLNAAAEMESHLDAHEILRITQDIERELGRTAKSSGGTHYDRCIDIDLLQYGDLSIRTPQLTLPHPRMAQRSFVLQPLAEIAPHTRHAAAPHPTFQQLLAEHRAYEVVPLTSAHRQCYDQICALLHELSPSKQLTVADFEALLADSHTHVALLCHRTTDGNVGICGMVVLCTTRAFSGTKAWIEDLCVATPHRGRGLSHRLLDWAIRRARSCGMKKVMLTSRPERRAANVLYRNTGFEQRHTNLYQLVL